MTSFSTKLDRVLNEILQTAPEQPIGFEKLYKDPVVYQTDFNVKGYPYKMTFSQWGDEEDSFFRTEFDMVREPHTDVGKMYSRTGVGAIDVLKTVAAITKLFIKDFKPGAVLWHAYDPTLNRTYNSMVKRLVPPGSDYVPANVGNHTGLVRKDKINKIEKIEKSSSWSHV